jgi:hypothetical protein
MASEGDKLKRSSCSLEFIEELMKFIKADNHVGTNELCNDCSPQGGLLSQQYLSYYIILAKGCWQKDMVVLFWADQRHALRDRRPCTTASPGCWYT